MKKLLFVPLALTIFILTGCKSTEPDEKPDGPRLVSEISGDGAVTTFTYDADQRISKITRKYESGETEVGTYAYTSTTVTETTPYGVNTYTLNSASYVSVANLDEDGDTGTASFTYDGSGYLSKCIMQFSGLTATVNAGWKDGNMSAMNMSSVAGSYAYAFQYGEISNTLCNIDLNMYMLELFPPLDIFGKRSANMINKIVYTETPGDYSYSITLSYKTDDKGYVTQVTATEDDDDPVVYTIKYK